MRCPQVSGAIRVIFEEEKQRHLEKPVLFFPVTSETLQPLSALLPLSCLTCTLKLSSASLNFHHFTSSLDANLSTFPVSPQSADTRLGGFAAWVRTGAPGGPRLPTYRLPFILSTHTLTPPGKCLSFHSLNTVKVWGEASRSPQTLIVVKEVVTTVTTARLRDTIQQRIAPFLCKDATNCTGKQTSTSHGGDVCSFSHKIASDSDMKQSKHTDINLFIQHLVRSLNFDDHWFNRCEISNCYLESL